jgi:hypothetical protein
MAFGWRSAPIRYIITTGKSLALLCSEACRLPRAHQLASYSSIERRMEAREKGSPAHAGRKRSILSDLQETAGPFWVESCPSCFVSVSLIQSCGISSSFIVSLGGVASCRGTFLGVEGYRRRWCAAAHWQWSMSVLYSGTPPLLFRCHSNEEADAENQSFCSTGESFGMENEPHQLLPFPPGTHMAYQVVRPN